MSYIWAIFRREVKSYFVSPLAYTASALFLAIMGVLFFAACSIYERARIRAAQSLQTVPGPEQLITDFLGSDLIWALLVIVPLLTMNLMAEERRRHTAELLLTAPVTTRQIVLGKYFGALFVLATMLLFSGWMPLYIWKLGHADPARIWSGYIGAMLYCAMLLALGMLASSITESPFLAALLAMVFIAIASVAGSAAESVPAIGNDLKQFTPSINLATFAQGVIDSQAVVYFISSVIFLLELSSSAVDSQRWR